MKQIKRLIIVYGVIFTITVAVLCINSFPKQNNNSEPQLSTATTGNITNKALSSSEIHTVKFNK